MIDSHIVPNPENWGILPSINFLGLKISSYSIFVLLGLIAGLVVYFYLVRKDKKDNKESGENSFYIVIAALVGGVIGAKLPYWIFYFPEIVNSYPNIMPFLSGRTILGGIIGGTLAVIYIKKKLGIKGRKGNYFVPAIALGVAIGRIGCFLTGCCYGIPTSLPWGVNFGDGIPRHPTQLYESIFMLILFFYFSYKLNKKPAPAPGELFDKFILIYFSWRFLLDFIRAEPKIFLGLTFFQYLSLAAIIWFSIRISKKSFQKAL